jgi:DNA-binding MarR family transcriptional regulator
MMEDKDKIGYLSDGDEDHDLYHLFTRARYLTFRAREKELQRYGLTPEQAQLLFTIRALNNKATPSEISRILIRKPHSVSSLVDRMEEKGLIQKSKDLERKNLVRVALTEEGRKAYELTTKRGPIHRIIGALDENERQQFRKNLEKIMAKARAELGMDRSNLPSSE